MIAQTLPISARRGSGRPDLPPAFTWIDLGHTCIAYLWVGGRENGVAQQIYDLSYQVRHRSRAYLGQIERNPRTGCWLVNNVQRQILPAAECVCYATWEEATAYIWECYQASRRAAVRAELED